MTLLEALIAMLLMAVGMVGLSALQTRLRVNSDVAKQRSEAVRIAQEDMENFRAYGWLAAAPAAVGSATYASIIAGATGKAALGTAGPVAANATYTVTRAVTESTQPDMKVLRVTVGWTSREGQAESVRLSSIVAKLDPMMSATLGTPPNGSPVRDTLGRDIQIPIPAKNLGDGTSVFKPKSDGTVAFVFNNDTGMIDKKCTEVASTKKTADFMAADVAGCTSVQGQLLSGHVRFSLGDKPDAINPNDAPPAGGATGGVAIRLDFDAAAPPVGMKGTFTQLTSAGWPASSAAVELDGHAPPDCSAEDSKTVSYETPVNFTQVSNGVTQTVTRTKVVMIVPYGTPITAEGFAPHAGITLADAPTKILNPTALGERYVAYTCVVYPLLSGSKPVPWTGRSLVVPSGWTLGTTSATYKVCRYSQDYNLNGYVWTRSPTPEGPNIDKIDNAEHPYAYLQVDGSLSHQNFLVIKGDKGCPTDGPVEVDGRGGENYADETTVLHQP